MKSQKNQTRLESRQLEMKQRMLPPKKPKATDIVYSSAEEAQVALSLPNERWRVIRAYSDYAVSDLGRVMRIRQVQNSRIGKILKPGLNSQGYAIVGLYRRQRGCRRGKATSLKVHRIVARMFMGRQPLNHEIHHRDNDRSNPALVNLVFVTHVENMAYRAGR